jgi:hypothetical protein
MHEKPKIEFLDLVFPLIFIYTSFLIGWTYFDLGGKGRNEWMDVAVLSMCSFFFTYGFITFLINTRAFGLVWLYSKLKQFFKLFDKNL